MSSLVGRIAGGEFKVDCICVACKEDEAEVGIVCAFKFGVGAVVAPNTGAEDPEPNVESRKSGLGANEFEFEFKFEDKAESGGADASS